MHPSRPGVKGDDLKEADTNKKKEAKKPRVNKVKSILFLKQTKDFILNDIFIQKKLIQKADHC